MNFSSSTVNLFQEIFSAVFLDFLVLSYLLNKNHVSIFNVVSTVFSLSSIVVEFTIVANILELEWVLYHTPEK